jgi:hypothetical protein
MAEYLAKAHPNISDDTTDRHLLHAHAPTDYRSADIAQNPTHSRMVQLSITL